MPFILVKLLFTAVGLCQDPGRRCKLAQKEDKEEVFSKQLSVRTPSLIDSTPTNQHSSFLHSPCSPRVRIYRVFMSGALMLIKNVKTLNASSWIWAVCTRWFLAGIISQAVEIARIGCSEEGFARLFDYWRSNWGYFPRVARKIGNQGHHVRTMAHLAHFLDSAIGTLLGARVTSIQQ